LQVGVKAPGTAKSTTLRSPKRLSVCTASMPFWVTWRSVPEGILSPVERLIIVSFKE